MKQSFDYRTLVGGLSLLVRSHGLGTRVYGRAVPLPQADYSVELRRCH